MRKWLVLVLLIAAACRFGEKKFERFAPFKPGSLGIHVVQKDPAAGLTRATVADGGETIYLNPSPELTEKHLRKIAVGKGLDDDRIVILTFTEEGAAILARVTAANVGNRLAVLVGGRVVTAPVLQSRIPGGEANIEGGFTQEAAERLVKTLAGS
jgi:preprotein translocase subunit SecD